MSITLSDGVDTINLHADLFWSDQNKWNPVEQTALRTITGALIVSSAARVAGRPITLEPENEASAWMTGTVVEALRNCAAVPGKEFTLTLLGDTYDVIFRHQDGGFEATPVVHYNDANSTDFYLCVLRFMEI